MYKTLIIAVAIIALGDVSSTAQMNPTGSNQSSTGNPSNNQAQQSQSQNQPQNQSQNSSGLQSEAQVLAFQSANDAITDLTQEMTSELVTDSSKHYSFVLNFPFAAEDIGNLRTLKQEITRAQRCIDIIRNATTFTNELSDFTRDYDLIKAHYHVRGNTTNQLLTNPSFQTQLFNALQTYRNKNGADIKLMALAAVAGGGAAGGGGGGGGGTPAVTGPTADIASDFTGVGVMLQAVNTLTTLIETSHSPFTTTQGNAGFNQNDINQLLVTDLLKAKKNYPTYNFDVFDFSRVFIAPIDEGSGDSPFLISLKHLTNDVHEVYRTINIPAPAATPPTPATPPPTPAPTPPTYVFPTEQAVSVAIGQLSTAIDLLSQQRAANDDFALAQAQILLALKWENLKVQFQEIKSALSLGELQGVASPNDKTNPANVTLNAIWAYIQELYGTVSPQLLLTTSPTGGGGTPGSQPASASTTFTLADGASLTVKLTSATNNSGVTQPMVAQQPAQQAQQPVQQAQQNQQIQIPGLGAFASPNFLNLVAKYDYLDYCEAKIGPNAFYLSCIMSVGDATQSKVTRTFLPDFVALSNRANIQLAAVAVSDDHFAYSNDAEKFHNYVYFPGRVRDGADNHQKVNDSLCPPPATTPLNSITTSLPTQLHQP